MSSHDNRDKPRRACMSFGGGVQSTAIAMLALNRDPRLLEVTDGVVPELYLFADTGDERRETYEHVWKMMETFAYHGVRLDIVMREQTDTNRGRTLSEHIVTSNGGRKKGVATAPFFVETQDGSTAPIRRGCTAQFKVKPLKKAQKKHFDVRPGQSVPLWQQWLGISVDEVGRMKDAGVRYYMTYYPLIWMGWTRAHCIEYLKTQTYADGTPIKIVRSSCVYCPFHDTEEWQHVKSDPVDWMAAIEFERGAQKAWEEGRLGGIKARPFLHPSAKNLEDVDFDETDEQQLSMWDNECAGICGV